MKTTNTFTNTTIWHCRPLLLTAIIVLIATSFTSARADNGDEFTSGILQYKILSEDDKTVELIGCEKKYEVKLVIPASVSYNGNDYAVTSIGRRAFAYYENLVSVTIPHSVTSIGAFGFSGCTKLIALTIPKSVISIGIDAFSSVKHIINQSECTNKNHWGALAENGTVDGDFVYENNEKTTLLAYIGKGGDVIIPNGVTSIGKNVFYQCFTLISVTIPESVTSIGYSAFQYCHNLTSIIIPNGVTSIGDWSLAFCRNLTSVTIPESVTSIGDYAFFEIKHINYNGTYKDNAPWHAISMNGIVDGDFVYEDAAKTKLLAYIGKGGDVIIPNSVSVIGKYAFLKCYNLTAITIPNSVTSIEDGAFNQCYSLTSVTIPNSVTSIGWVSFFNVKHIINRSACTHNEHWGAHVENGTIDGDFVYENDEKTTLLAYIGKGGNVTIPNSVTSVVKYAFSDCKKITSVTIPNSVTYIGENAFYQCTSLTDVYLSADPEKLEWDEDGCDDFIIFGDKTKCYVPKEYCSKYINKFTDKVNVIFLSK